MASAFSNDHLAGNGKRGRRPAPLLGLREGEPQFRRPRRIGPPEVFWPSTPAASGTMTTLQLSLRGPRFIHHPFSVD